MWSTSYRGLFLIHTGKSVDPNAFSHRDKRFSAVPCNVLDHSFVDHIPLRDDYERGGIIGYATLKEVVTSSASPWYIHGQYGFVLRECHPLPFIPLRGRLGFFTVLREIEAQVQPLIWRESNEELRERS